MPVADYAIASLVVAGGAVIGCLQYRRLHGSRARQIVTAPAGWMVRLNILVVACGVWTLTNVWAVVAFPAAVIAWELAVRFAGLIARARHRGTAAAKYE